MVDTSFEFTIENEEAFSRLLDTYADKISDFSGPFRSISSNWFRRNKRIFLLKSEGLYAPLGGFNPNSPAGKGNETRRQRAERIKEKKVGRSWAPILLGTDGKLKAAATGGAGSFLSIGRKELVMGVDDAKVPYAKFHNSNREPRTKLPQRKFIFISGGKDKARDAQVGNDIKVWTMIIEDHVKEVLG